MNGLNITEDEFMKLPVKQQNAILYQNTELIKKMIGGYRFQQRIVIGWLSGFTVLGGYLAIQLIDHLKT
jgi:hypothetical protein